MISDIFILFYGKLVVYIIILFSNIIMSIGREKDDNII